MSVDGADLAASVDPTRSALDRAVDWSGPSAPQTSAKSSLDLGVHRDGSHSTSHGDWLWGPEPDSLL